MGRESSELHRMEAHIKELQAELDVANANLNTVRRQRRELEAERDVLHGALTKAGGLADVDRWPERYPLVYGCMTDAITEVDVGD
jgi:chromosome segregation ATPase